MRVFIVLVAVYLSLAGAVRADALPLDAADCGGDAFSAAQVVEHRPVRRGPLTAVPDTLCADLAPQHPLTQVDIIADPLLAQPVGLAGLPTPYDGRLPPTGRLLRPRTP